MVEAARSISPEMKESDYTLEQLQRPNANYVILIHEAITSAEAKEMNLQQIYHAIEKKYPFYRFKVTTTGWQSSVRHNLQQNGAFMKIRREGKGYVWGINPDVSIEKEKRKRVTPPPTTSVSRSSYHCYSATHLHSHGQGTTPAYYGLAATHPHARYPALQQQQQTNHQSSPHPQQAQQSQPSLKGNAIPTPTPTNIRTYSSPYASPYAPLQSGTSSQSPAPLAKHQQQVHPLAPPPLPSTYRQVPHSPKSAYPGYSGQPTPPPSGSSVESSTTQAQNQATSSAAAAAADNAVLFQRLKQNQGPTSPLGNSTDLSNPHGRHSTGARKPTNPGTLASPGEDSVTKSDVHLYGLPSETVATLLADFRKRFLGANEQSARSESIIDPIIRRFTQPMETQSPPGENELVIIRIIHGMLRDMRQGRSGGLLSAIAHTAAPASLSSVMNEERQSAAIDEKETIVVAGRAAPLSDQETPGTQLSQRNREQLTNVRQSPARERNQTAAQVAAAADAATSGESGPSAESKGQEHTSAEQSKEEADRPAARPVRETRSRWRSNSGAGNGPPGITGFSDKLPTVEVDDGTVPAVSPKELDGRDQDQNADPGQDQDQEKDEEQDQDQRRATRTSKKRTATFSPRIHSISIGGGGLKRRKDYMETRSSMAAAAAKGTAMSNSSQEMSTKRRRGRPRS